MSRVLPLGLLVAAVIVAGAAASTTLWQRGEHRAGLPNGPHPLTTGFLLDADVSQLEEKTVGARIAAVGSRIERIHAIWGEIAPKKRPSGFDATDPGSKAYRFATLDREVADAHAAGLEPLLTVTGAPRWTQRQGVNTDRYGASDPTPSDYADFGTALARRYSGTYHGLPRVRLWEAWNEPNVSFYFTPQTAGGPNNTRVDVAANLYRNLLNAFADAVHAVNASNVVAGGALGPFTIRGVSYVETTGGVRFLRELLCLADDGDDPKPTCDDKVHMDALSFHPYTSGGPLHKAYKAGDLSLGNMAEARAVLDAGVRAGHVVSARPVQLWVTEFSWDTSPPDPRAVPMSLHTRWVAEALYRMWQNGVSLLVWYQVRDWVYPGADYQSGLWFRGKTLAQDRPKPSLVAFRFPFVAYRSDGTTTYWGRVPVQRKAKVRIQLRSGGVWRDAGRATAGRYGVFAGTLPHTGSAVKARAVVEGDDASAAFALTPPRNENLAVTPFGVGSIK